MLNQRRRLSQIPIRVRALLWVAIFPALLWMAAAISAEPLPISLEFPAADSSLKKPFDDIGKSTALGAVETKAVVFVFYLHDCPICNAYAPEIERIQTAYASKGFSIYIVQTDASLTAAAALRHAKEYALTPPVLLDGENRLARLFGATVTPEVAVVGPVTATGKMQDRVLYLGRIDDLYADYGKRRPAATAHDLRVALDAISAGKPASRATGAAVGCFIPLSKRDESRK